MGPPHRLLREINRSPSRVKKSVENLAQDLRGGGGVCAVSSLAALSRSCLLFRHAAPFISAVVTKNVYYCADERSFCVALRASLLMP